VVAVFAGSLEQQFLLVKAAKAAKFAGHLRLTWIKSKSRSVRVPFRCTSCTHSPSIAVGRGATDTLSCSVALRSLCGSVLVSAPLTQTRLAHVLSLP
jgi:hypothetical protein